MKTALFVFVATSLVASCAMAQADAAQSKQHQQPPFGAFEAISPTGGNLATSPAQCEPGLSRPVWGANEALVGFRCSSNAN